MLTSPLRTARVLLVVTALLVAQWVLAQHEVQIGAHTADTACEWCLAHTPLAGALPAAALFFTDTPACSFVGTAVVAGLHSVFHPFYASRAPPFSPVV